MRPRCRSGWEIGNWELGNVFNPWSCFTKLISHFSYSAIFYEEADNVVMTWVIVSDICFITSIHIYNPVENITISYILTQPWIFWIITVFILKISKKNCFQTEQETRYTLPINLIPTTLKQKNSWHSLYIWISLELAPSTFLSSSYMRLVWNLPLTVSNLILIWLLLFWKSFRRLYYYCCCLANSLVCPMSMVNHVNTMVTSRPW